MRTLSIQIYLSDDFCSTAKFLFAIFIVAVFNYIGAATVRAVMNFDRDNQGILLQRLSR